MYQKNVFMSREGNEWYERNKAAILGKSLASDPIFKAIVYGDGMDCPQDSRHFLSSRRGLFEGLRANATKMTMASDPVIKCFNVIEDIGTG